MQFSSPNYLDTRNNSLPEFIDPSSHLSYLTNQSSNYHRSINQPINQSTKQKSRDGIIQTEQPPNGTNTVPYHPPVDLSLSSIKVPTYLTQLTTGSLLD